MGSLPKKTRTPHCLPTIILRNPSSLGARDRSTNGIVGISSNHCSLHACAIEISSCFSRMDVEFQTSPVVNEEVVIAVSESEFAGRQHMPDHDYLATSAHHTRETDDIGIQTDLGMEEMTELLGLMTKSQNPNAIMRELFVQKVTSSDKNVKQCTGVPSKSILDGLFCVLDEASPNLNTGVARVVLRSPIISKILN